MATFYKVPLLLTPESDGGYVVTSPILPELITEGDSLGEALEHVRDALAAVVELYADLGKPLPPQLRQDATAEAIELEYPVVAG